MDKRNQNIKNRIEKRRGANLVPFTTIRKQLRSEYIEEKQKITYFAANQ